MLIRRSSDIPSPEITDESLFWNRRSFIKAAGPGAAAVTMLPCGWRNSSYKQTRPCYGRTGRSSVT
jgi:hypothetical protein